VGVGGSSDSGIVHTGSDEDGSSLDSQFAALQGVGVGDTVGDGGGSVDITGEFGMGRGGDAGKRGDQMGVGLAGGSTIGAGVDADENVDLGHPHDVPIGMDMGMDTAGAGIMNEQGGDIYAQHGETYSQTSRTAHADFTHSARTPHTHLTYSTCTAHVQHTHSTRTAHADVTHSTCTAHAQRTHRSLKHH
jgi:hypothetical protein